MITKAQFKELTGELPEDVLGNDWHNDYDPDHDCHSDHGEGGCEHWSHYFNKLGGKKDFCVEGRHFVEDTKIMIGDNCEDHDKDYSKRMEDK